MAGEPYDVVLRLLRNRRVDLIGIRPDRIDGRCPDYSIRRNEGLERAG